MHTTPVPASPPIQSSRFDTLPTVLNPEDIDVTDNILRSLGKGYELSDGMSVSDAESLEADKRTQMQELAARAKQKIELAATALNSACSADEEDGNGSEHEM